LHKKNALIGSLAGLNSPLLETQDEWVLHGFSFANYLEELGPKAQSEIYEKSSIISPSRMRSARCGHS